MTTRYTPSPLDTKDQLDQAAETLEAIVNTTLEELVLSTKLLLYTKK